MAQILLIWVTLSLAALSHSQKIPAIKNLDCVNDFIKHVSCIWEVDSSTNCAKDFSLMAERKLGNEHMDNYTCNDLENEQHNICRCRIIRDYFILEEKYNIEVTSHGKLVGTTTMTSKSKLKPNAPSNVQAESKDAQVIVKWNSEYDGNFLRNLLTFNVQFLYKEDRKEAKSSNLPQDETSHSFYKSQLKRGDYIIRVRSKPRDNSGFWGPWSDWSPETEWRNDYRPSIVDQMHIIIPTISILLIFLIIVTYISIIRCRNKWWNNIPDPAKSRLANSKLLQKNQLHSDRKHFTKKSCINILSRLFKTHGPNWDKPPNTTMNYVNVYGGSDYKIAIFVPEDDIIENTVEMFPIKQDEKSPVQEDKLECKSDHHFLGDDSSFAKVFSDILDDHLLGTRLDAFKNFNTGNLFGSPTFKDTLDNEEAQGSNSKMSQCRDSGYQSYDSDDSPLESRSDNNEKDLMTYTTSVRKTENCCYQNKEAPLLNIGYNSLANALVEARIDPIIDTTENLFPVLRNSINHPKGILYYNTKSSILENTEGNLLSNIIPATTFPSHGHPAEKPSVCQVYGYKSLDQLVKENVPKLGYKSFNQAVQENGPVSEPQRFRYKSFDQEIQENCPALTCHISGYKSFDEAIQENGLEHGCQTSGYKSFDQAVQETAPAFGCDMSGYKSCDQAVQENGPVDGCHMPDYQHFDQAVQQGEETSAGHMTGYQSFDQAVQEGRKSFPGHMAGYQSFDQAIQQGGETFVGHMTGYQSFDQAVQQGVETSVGHMTGYQSFDQAVQKGVETSVGHMTGYQSFDRAFQRGETCGSTDFPVFDSEYKPFESLVSQNGGVLDKKYCIHETESQHQLGDHHCKHIKDSSKTEDFIHGTDSKSNQGFDSSGLPSSGFCKAWDSNGMKLKHGGMPLALTFDICEHLRNLEKTHGQKIALSSLQPDIFPITQAVFPCLTGGLPSIHVPVTVNKYLTGQNSAPATDNFENVSYFVPFYELQKEDLSQPSTHLLIQQMVMDNDGNSYMKIGLV